jgi:membrane fusion protein, multidrug efflux system
MLGAFKKFGFAGTVLAVMLLAAGAVAVKTVLDGQGQGAPGASQKATAQAGPRAGGPPGGGGGPGGGRPDATRVRLETVQPQSFYDIVQALGTAQARESVVITPKVADVIQSLRFDSGDRVARGQVLVVLASVEQQADLAEAQAQLDAAKRDFERFAELGGRGFAPVSRVEEARAAYDRAQARVKALEARIADRTIRAPFSGVIGLRTASPGALARPGDPIATLDDVSVIKLDFDVPESQIDRVRPGAEIEARSAASPDQVFRGRVEDVDSRLNATTRTLRARAVLPNERGLLKPGMLLTVNVRFNPRDALSVPEIALLERSDGLFVFRVDQTEGRGIAALAPVRVGRRVDGRAEVIAGLKAGDVVVVEGVQRVRAGQAVQAVVEDGPRAGPPAKAAPASAQSVVPAKAAPAKSAPPKAAPAPISQTKADSPPAETAPQLAVPTPVAPTPVSPTPSAPPVASPPNPATLN